MQMQEHVLSFRIPNSDSGEVYIDIAKSMSMVSRKLFRQQGLWHVHGVCTYADSALAATPAKTTGVPYTVAIGGAPRNWVTRNSLVKAFSAWKDQQKKVYDSISPSIKPKWQDFKVYLNDNHRVTGDITPTSGHMFGGVDAYNGGEWIYSKLVVESADGAGAVVQSEPFLHILGDNNGLTSVGTILNYQESRSIQQSPNPALPIGWDDNIYALSADPLSDQLEEITENMGLENNNPPYDNDDYPGNDSNGNEPILYAFGANATTAKRKLTLNGFAAPNGLLEIQYNKDIPEEAAPNSGELWIQLFVSHREAY